MTKETIYNNYAIEKGYKNWSAILFQFQDDFNYASPEDENNVMNWIEHHINAVTDLIQEELKKKIANIEDIHIEDFDEFGDVYVLIGTDKNTILNTEIL